MHVSLSYYKVMGMDDAEGRKAEFEKGEKAYSDHKLNKKLLREALVPTFVTGLANGGWKTFPRPNGHRDCV